MYVKRSLHKLHGHYNHVSPHQNSICTSCIPCISYVATTLLYLPTKILYVHHAFPAQVTWPLQSCISPPKFHMYIMRSLHKLRGHNTFVSPHQNTVCTSCVPCTSYVATTLLYLPTKIPYVHHAFAAQVTWLQHFCISPPKFCMYIRTSCIPCTSYMATTLLTFFI